MKTQQLDVNKYRVNVFLDIGDVAKLRTLLRGKTVPARQFSNRTTRAIERPKTISDQVSEMIHDLVRDVKTDVEATEWEIYQRKKQIENRQEADEAVAAGVNRKPRSEWLKPGRVAGKDYSKVYAKIRAKKRAEKKAAKKAKQQQKDKGK